MKGKKEEVEQTLIFLRKERQKTKRRLIRYEKAHAIVKQVELETQRQLQFHISDITSLALEAVFPNAYTLDVDFIEKRNKIECDLYFVRDGQRIKPVDASGGGAVDVAAFALRTASWSMESPRTDNVLLMDEPLRFLSLDLQDKASEMIKEIANKLKLQFIIITHDETLSNYGDKLFDVKLRKGVSRINEV